MRSRFSRPVSGAVLFLFAFLLALPAAAQTPAKDAWSHLREFARGMGVTITARSATDYGTSLVAQNVRIFAADAPEGLVIAMPELRVEPRGAAIALIPAPQFTVQARPAPRERLVLTLSHSGEIVLQLTEDLLGADMVFERLTAVLTEATQRGTPMDAAFEMTLDGFVTRARITREGSVDVALDAEALSYDFAFSDGDQRQSTDARVDNFHVQLTGAEWDMLSDAPGSLRAAFDAGFFARLEMTTAASQGTSSQTVDGLEIALTSASGASDLLFDVSQGAVSMETSGHGLTLSGGAAPFTGEASIAQMRLSLGAPVLATAQDARFHAGLSIEGVEVSPQLLAPLGAADLAAEPVTLVAEVSALGRLTRDLGPEFGDGREPPLDLTSVSLDRLETSVAGARLTGSGAFAFLGGMLSSLGADVPNGTGDFVFELVGGDALLTRLSALGLIPQDQQFVARMMMNGLGRPIGEDHLRSEVAIRPGGVVTVNGAPLPF